MERNGKQVKVVYNFLVMETMLGDRQNFECESFKFSAGDQALDVHALASADGGSANLQAWWRQAQLSALISSASALLIEPGHLSPGALGQTTGEGESAEITLDPTAAGHGWYLDPTPLKNDDDFLPTADANVWLARPGSEAEGKMDLLSVLLHEYGHALGLEHSADARNFMAATLQPGERRLPSEGELQLMAQLTAQLTAQLVAQRRAEDEGLGELGSGAGVRSSVRSWGHRSWGQVFSFKPPPPRRGYPITSATTSRSVLMSAAERLPMTRKMSPCSMVVKTGLSTDSLTSPAPFQSATIASPKPSGVRT